MSITKKLFGKLADGTEVYRYTLKNKNGMKVKILSYGGTIAQIKVPDRNGAFSDVVGGYDGIQRRDALRSDNEGNDLRWYRYRALGSR